MQPPQHSATARPRYIAKDDPAFDSDRFIEEIKTLREGETHPLAAYWAGVGRYDLEAPGKLGDQVVSPRDYLLPDKTPVVFTLRRLRMRELSRVLDLDVRAGQMLAFQLGLGRIDGHPTIEAKDYTTAISDAETDRLADVLGAGKMYEVGVAVINASAAPTPAEGKG